MTLPSRYVEFDICLTSRRHERARIRLRNPFLLRRWANPPSHRQPLPRRLLPALTISTHDLRPGDSHGTVGVNLSRIPRRRAVSRRHSLIQHQKGPRNGLHQRHDKQRHTRSIR